MELRKIRGQTLPTGIISKERSDPSKFIQQPGERSQDAPSSIEVFIIILTEQGGTENSLRDKYRAYWIFCRAKNFHYAPVAQLDRAADF